MIEPISGVLVLKQKLKMTKKGKFMRMSEGE
jgi:hypothetical protein